LYLFDYCQRSVAKAASTSAEQVRRKQRAESEVRELQVHV